MNIHNGINFLPIPYAAMAHQTPVPQRQEAQDLRAKITAEKQHALEEHQAASEARSGDGGFLADIWNGIGGVLNDVVGAVKSVVGEAGATALAIGGALALLPAIGLAGLGLIIGGISGAAAFVARLGVDNDAAAKHEKAAGEAELGAEKDLNRLKEIQNEERKSRNDLEKTAARDDQVQVLREEKPHLGLEGFVNRNAA